jgi:D-hexose-6-phosphate mutarotase
MVCVETVNAAPHVITVAPGAQHSLGTTFSVAV